MAVPYVHHADIHNDVAPSIMVPVIVDMFRPKSVIDVGCGTGNFLGAFKSLGVQVHGVDGSWADTSAYLAAGEFTAADLSNPLNLKCTFDLVVSLEVAEHLPPEAADTFVASLVALGDTVIFSAAVPQQGGQNHLNEQWPSYWIAKFAKHGYVPSNALRSAFWGDDRLFPWYRQNVIVFTRGGDPEEVADVVHPALYRMWMDIRAETMQGRGDFLTYALLFWKWARRQVGFDK